MGFMDRFEKALSAVKAVADTGWHALPPVAFGGFAIDLATAPWHDADDYDGFLNTIKSRAAARLGDVLEPLDVTLGGADEWLGGNVLMPALHGLDKGYQYGISRPAVTLLHASGVPGQEAHAGAFLNPANWREAWNSSRDVSPGQAAYSGTLGQAGRIARQTGIDPLELGRAIPIIGAWVNSANASGMNLGGVTDEDFDVLDPADRDAAFKHGPGRLATGTLDGIMRWHLDPAVLAGRGAASLRQDKLIRPITAGTDVDKVLASQRITGFVDEIAAQGDSGSRMAWLMRNKSIRDADDGSALAYLLSHPAPGKVDPPDADEMIATLRYAIDSSPTTRRRLAEHSEDRANQVDNLRDVRLPALQAALDRTREGVQVGPWAQRQLDVANQQIKAADAERRYSDLLFAAEGSLRAVPRVSAGQKIADKVGWHAYQPSPYNVPMRVARSATTWRPGVVDLNRTDSIDEIGKMLDTVKGLDTAERGRLLAGYAAAGNEAAKQTAIDQAAAAALRATFTAHGLRPETADAVLAMSWRRMDEQRVALTERAYSGARGSDGRFVDEVDVDGVATRLPLDVSQLANHVPLPDIAAYERIIARYKSQIAGDEDGFLSALGGIRGSKASEFAAGHLEEAASAVARLWKPAQLFRLGWPIRVISDEQLRMAATLGTMSQMHLAGSSLTAQGPAIGAGLADKVTGRRLRAAGQVERFTKRIARIDTEIAAGVDDATKATLLADKATLTTRLEARAAKLTPKPVSEFGRGEMNVGGYRVQDAFGADDVPNIYKSLASSRPAWAHLAEDSGRRLNEMRDTRAATWVNLLPDDPAYAAGWTRAVNEQIRSSPLGKRILAGETDEQVVAWLRTPEGKAYGSRLPIRSHDPHGWVGELRVHIDAYLPTPELKALALSGKATADDLVKAVPDRSLRPVIHGESLEMALGTSKIMGTVDKAIQNMYAKLGAAPTDVLSRQPFFAGVYRQEMARRVARHDGEHLTTADLRHLEQRSREYALRQVRTTMYELGAQTNLAHLTRFVMPFYSAWQEVLTRWIGLSLDDPSRLAHGLQIWTSPNRAGLVVDSKGEPVGVDSEVPAEEQYLVVPLPTWFSKHVPGAANVESLALPKASLNTILSGPNPLVPGIGPIAAIPIAALVRDRPDLTESFDLVLPYGAGKSWKDQVLPAWAKRVASAAEEDRTYLNSVNKIVIELETDRRRGLTTLAGQDLYAEAVKRAKSFWKLRTVANWTLPVSPAYRSPYEPFFVAARNYRESYAKMPLMKDPTGRSWEEAYLDDFGADYFTFTESLSKSINSVAPTVEGYRATEKFGDLLSAHPDQGSLIVVTRTQVCSPPRCTRGSSGRPLGPVTRGRRGRRRTRGRRWRT